MIYDFFQKVQNPIKIQKVQINLLENNKKYLILLKILVFS